MDVDMVPDWSGSGTGVCAADYGEESTVEMPERSLEGLTESTDFQDLFSPAVPGPQYDPHVGPSVPVTGLVGAPSPQYDPHVGPSVPIAGQGGAPSPEYHPQWVSAPASSGSVGAPTSGLGGHQRRRERRRLLFDPSARLRRIDEALSRYPLRMTPARVARRERLREEAERNRARRRSEVVDRVREARIGRMVDADDERLTWERRRGYKRVRSEQQEGRSKRRR